MAVIPYDAANGEELYDGTKDFPTMDNAADPASHDPLIHSATTQADYRDFAEYIRGSSVIGNAKKIQGYPVTDPGATPSDGQVL